MANGKNGNGSVVFLPEGWAEARLSDILAEIVSGSRPKGGVQSIKSGIPSIGGEHLAPDGGFRFEKIKYVPEDFAKKLFSGWIRQGDVLVVKDGATTGKTSFVGTDFPFEKALVNEHVLACRTFGAISSKFVFYFLHSEQGQAAIRLDFRGAAQGGISRGFADKVLFPLAPAAEQERIAEKIDSLRERSRKVRAALEAIPPLLERFRQAVLGAAFRGELTEKWRAENPKTEPASKLLERIRTERRKKWEEAELAKLKAAGKIPKDNKWKERYPEPRHADATDLPELPKGWVWASVEELTDRVTDGEHITPPRTKFGIPLMSARNVL